MRTRRSPKNQMALWRALGGAGTKPAPVDAVAAAERAMALPLLSPRTRRMLERDLARARHRAAVERAKAPRDPFAAIAWAMPED